jgi:hypothetical protein
VAERGAGLLGAVQRLFESQLLVLSPAVAEPGVAFRAGVSLGEGLRQLWPVLEALCVQGRQHVIVALGIGAQEKLSFQGQGFQFFRLPSRTELVLPATYEDWLRSLSMPRRKRDRRRSLAYAKGRASDRGVSIRVLQGRITDHQLYYHMLREVYRHHGRELDLRHRLFEAFEREFGQDLVAAEGWIRGELCGFVIGLREDDHMQIPLAGLRYERTGETGLYLLMFDALIAWAIERRLQRVNGGLGTVEMKRRLGFRELPLWGGYRFRPSSLNRVMRGAVPAGGAIVRGIEAFSGGARKLVSRNVSFASKTHSVHEA